MKTIVLPIVLAGILVSCEIKNSPPGVIIITPADNQSFAMGDTVNIYSEVEDEDGYIREVRLYIDQVGVDSRSTFPYQFEFITDLDMPHEYSIKVVAIDDEGMTGESEVISFNTGHKPEADFTVSNDTVFVDSLIYFTDLSQYSPSTWHWDFGDSNTSIIQNPTHSYSEEGQYKISLVVTNEFGSNQMIKDNHIFVRGPLVFTDLRDGQIYKSVIIGDQTWMAENLRATKYNNGSEIPCVESGSAWAELTNENAAAYCYYENNSIYGDTYGVLYTFDAAMGGSESSNTNPSGVQGVCPEGWHIPSNEEWNELEDYLIANGYNFDGSTTENKIGKSLANTSGWETSTEIGDVGNNQQSNNSSGFTALPGGIRSADGKFHNFGQIAYFWSATNADFKKIYSTRKDLTTSSTANVFSGMSVRCVKN